MHSASLPAQELRAKAAALFERFNEAYCYVDPSLPAWLPDLTVRDLLIGKHLSLLKTRFKRIDDRSHPT